MRFRRRPRSQSQIDVNFARVLASQVSCGLMRNAEPASPEDEKAWAVEMEEAAARARLSLHAIGLMLRNAVEDELVDAALALSDTATIERLPGGGIRAVVRNES